MFHIVRCFQRCESLADALSEKINQRPTAVFAQELSTHCSRGVRGPSQGDKLKRDHKYIKMCIHIYVCIQESLLE